MFAIIAHIAIWLLLHFVENVKTTLQHTNGSANVRARSYHKIHCNFIQSTGKMSMFEIMPKNIFHNSHAHTNLRIHSYSGISKSQSANKKRHVSACDAFVMLYDSWSFICFSIYVICIYGHFFLFFIAPLYITLRSIYLNEDYKRQRVRGTRNLALHSSDFFQKF